MPPPVTRSASNATPEPPQPYLSVPTQATIEQNAEANGRHSVNIDIGFDPVSCIIALIALAITYIEHRRNNKTELSLQSIKSSFAQTIKENDEQPFNHLEVVVWNKGLPLFNPKLELTFERPDYQGTFSYVMEVEKEYDLSEFRRGMRAKFHLKSYRMRLIDHDVPLFELVDPLKQQARFRIYSQTYLAYEIPVARRWQFIIEKWNLLAHSINQRFWRDVESSKGEKFLETPDHVPTLSDTAFRVMSFVRRPQARGGKTEAQLTRSTTHSAAQAGRFFRSGISNLF